MTRLFDPYSILEKCLARLNTGEDLEAVLADYPQQAAELRPLLIAALTASRSGVPLRVPASAQIDSRTRFLAEAERRRARQKRFFSRLSLSGAVAIILIVFFAGIFGTGLASAKTVPGETLYPVKRVVEQAQLALTTNQNTRLNLEEAFDRRRVEEAEALKLKGRSEAVTLAGPLEESDDQGWTVGGVRLNLTGEQESLARTLSGSYIEVKGKIRGEEGVEVESLELRLFTFSGTLEEISGNEWKVSGVKVHLSDSTQITGKPRIGRRVELTTLHFDEDSFLALTVRVTGGSNGGNSKNNDKESSQPAITDSAEDRPEDSLEPSRTPEPDGQDSSHSDDSTQSPDSGDDNHRLTETYQPEEEHEATQTPD